MRRLQLSLFLIFFLSILLTLAAAGFAGPPSLTDDPEPVDFKHWEAYLFSTVNTTGRQTDACLHKSAVAGAFLDGVIMASLALMASVTWSLGRDAVIDLPAALLVLASAGLLFRFRLNSLWLVLDGALTGFLIYVARM